MPSIALVSALDRKISIHTGCTIAYHCFGAILCVCVCVYIHPDAQARHRLWVVGQCCGNVGLDVLAGFRGEGGFG